MIEDIWDLAIATLIIGVMTYIFITIVSPFF